MMTAKDFKDFRSHMEMKQIEFGQWLSDRTGKNKPYSAPEISAFESGRKNVPGIAQAAIYKFLLDRELEQK